MEARGRRRVEEEDGGSEQRRKDFSWPAWFWQGLLWCQLSPRCKVPDRLSAMFCCIPVERQPAIVQKRQQINHAHHRQPCGKWRMKKYRWFQCWACRQCYWLYSSVDIQCRQVSCALEQHNILWKQMLEMLSSDLYWYTRNWNVFQPRVYLVMVKLVCWSAAVGQTEILQRLLNR